MFFTATGRIVAYLLVAGGVFRAGLGFALATWGTPALSARYFGSSGTGAAIDGGLIAIGLGVTLGVLTDISRSIKR